jgi:hypothetical protein
MKVCGVADGADETRHAFARPFDGEVIEERSKCSGACSTSDHYFVGGWFWHVSTLATAGVVDIVCSVISPG